MPLWEKAALVLYKMDWIKEDTSKEQDELNRDIDILIYNCVRPNTQISALDAAHAYIKEITKKYPPPYTLMCSSGVDSQAMLWAWYTSGVPFICHNVKYITDDIYFNSHDAKELITFTSIHNISVEYSIFDCVKFYNSPQYLKNARAYNCCSPQIGVYIKMVEDLPGTKIFGGNFIDPYKQLSIDYTILGLKRYAEKSNDNVIPFFFLGDQNLAFAFYETEKNVLSTTSTYDRKCVTYQQCGFPVIPQETKFTGFEKIKDYYDEHYSKDITAADKLYAATKPSKRTHDVILRYRTNRLLGDNMPKLQWVISY